MPSRSKKLERDVAKLPSIPKELVEQFLTGPMTQEAINAAGLAFKQALIEASLNAELTHHLGYPAGGEKPAAPTNHRNGGTPKTVLTRRTCSCPSGICAWASKSLSLPSCWFGPTARWAIEILTTRSDCAPSMI